MATTKLTKLEGVEVGEPVYRIQVDVTERELNHLDITPGLLELELKNIFRPRRKPVEYVTDGIAEFFTINEHINKMYVDHLVINLEQRSIFDIVMFLCRYCGWDRIKKQMDEYLETLQKG